MKKDQTLITPFNPEKHYLEDLPSDLRSHQWLLIKDWLNWKFRKGDGQLARDWMGETIVSIDEDGKHIEKRIGLEHRLLEELHILSALEVLKIQKIIGILSKKAGNSRVVDYIKEKTGLSDAVESESNIKDGDIDNRILMLNVPLTTQEWEQLANHPKMDDLSLRAAIDLVKKLAPDRVEEMYDLCVFRILNDINLVNSAIATGLGGFTLPLTLLNYISDPLTAGAAWFWSRILYQKFIAKDNLKRIHTVCDNDFVIVEMLKDVLSENGLNGDFGFSPEAMKAAFEGRGRVEWINGNFPIISVLLGMLASGSNEQFIVALTTVLVVKLGFKFLSKNTDSQPNIEENVPIDKPDGVQENEDKVKDPFFARLLVSARKKIESRRRVHRDRAMLSVLFNDSTFLMGLWISVKFGEVSAFAGITTMGRLILQRMMKEVNSEENISVWRKFNEAMKEVRNLSSQDIEEALEAKLAEAFSKSDAEYFQEALEDYLYAIKASHTTMDDILDMVFNSDGSTINWGSDFFLSVKGTHMLNLQNARQILNFVFTTIVERNEDKIQPVSMSSYPPNFADIFFNLEPQGQEQLIDLFHKLSKLSYSNGINFSRNKILEFILNYSANPNNSDLMYPELISQSFLARFSTEVTG